jgi:AraC-like DNA-binding protein
LSSITVSARIGAMVVHAAAARGVEPERLCELTGFDVASAKDPDERIPLAVETQLWDEAARLTGDDAFGLHVAAGIRPGVFDVLDYACRTAPTLRVSFERLIRYNRLEHDIAVFSYVERGSVGRLEHRFRIPGIEPSRQAAEFTMASIVVIGGQILGEALRPRAVEFRHTAPRETVEHLRAFGVEPRFGCEANALELDREVLERPVPNADPALSRIIVRQAEALLAARPEVVETTADRVRRLLVASLGEGDVTLAGMADKLRMSERTLQRRLAEEGLTFEDLVEQQRKELALQYLADVKLAVSEVAYLLGYSEPSAFHRAFKRWTGMTPKELRARAA